MQVPTVTDDMLRKLIDNAASPVAVLFLDGDPDRMWFVSRLFDRAAEQFDDRTIFVRIHVAENPTVSAYWMNAEGRPEVVIFRKTWPKARLFGEFSTARVMKLVEAVLEEHYR
jgi:hypothetical protein